MRWTLIQYRTEWAASTIPLPHAKMGDECQSIQRCLAWNHNVECSGLHPDYLAGTWLISTMGELYLINNGR